MKRFGQVLLSLAVITGAGSAFADSHEPKLAVLDVPKILKASPQMEATANHLKKEFKPRQDKIVALQKSLQENQAKMKRDTAVMSQGDLRKLGDKINNDQRDLRRLEEDYMADARAAQKEAMSKIIKKINELVKKVAEKGQYDLVLQKEYVAYADDKIDITDQVIKTLRDKK